jgi:hypothetical protein
MVNLIGQLVKRFSRDVQLMSKPGILVPFGANIPGTYSTCTGISHILITAKTVTSSYWPAQNKFATPVLHMFGIAAVCFVLNLQLH